MKAKRLLTWLFVLMSIALLVVGFFLLKNAKWNSDGVKAQITVVYENGEEERVTGNTVKTNLSGLAPTFSETYEVKLKLVDGGEYTFGLDFSETKDGGLKNYVDVTVKDGATTVAEGTLAELLGGGKVNYTKSLSDGGTLTLKFVYTMQQDVTDEAAGGASAAFNIKIGIKE